MFEDNLDNVYDELFRRRSVGLHHRFPGWYRAVVEETNDPLQFYRVRIRCPELHNSDVKVEDLPWALPAPWHGGRNSGSWASPAIKDIVYVCFEKNHPYTIIYCSAADPTRRRMYSMWSIYTKSPLSVTEDGTPAETPVEYEEDYLPKDGRPMSMGMNDRYGHFFFFNSVGFSPKTHKIEPASVGTDALAKKDFNVAKAQPEDNEPDTKYVAMGTKYGHHMMFGDQGYKWFEEFKGDFEEDKDFEEKRYKYFVKFFNEQEPKDRDQRRIEFRTRMGHMMELRDVGWDKSRSGEYGDQKTIGDSQGRDERWMKFRSKGGHLMQLIDVGFDPESDNYYKRLNKSEFGEMDEEDQLGEDKRMIRLISRHGNQLILDDRGSDPVDASGKTSPHGNGFLLRTRKGFQIQGVDKPELDHLLIVSPKEQVIEINDKEEYINLSTTSSGQLHTDINPTSLRSTTGTSTYVESSGQKYDPASNTYHMILDKKNCMVRLKTPTGAGIEMRDKEAPCGEWVETRDSENRAVWMSAKDNYMLIRGKKGVKYILLDDNDDVILIRNEDGKIQIRAKKNIEIKSDEGDICLEALNGQVGIRAKSVDIQTSGASHKIDGTGIGTTKIIQGQTLLGFHPQMGCLFGAGGTAPGSGAGRDGSKSGNPCKVEDKILLRKKPDDFDKERGCETNKDQKGPVPTSVIISPPGGGTGGGLPPSGGGGGGGPQPSSPVDPPPRSPTSPEDIPAANEPEPPPPVEDPIEDINPGGGGVLWYGLSAKFKDEIGDLGLLVASLSNNLNTPNTPDDEIAVELHLARSVEIASGNKQAVLSQKRYGDVTLVLRIRNVPDGDLLSDVEDDDDLVSYKGDIPFDSNIEVFEIGNKELTQPPLFPNA